MNPQPYNEVPYVEINQIAPAKGTAIGAFWGKKVKRLTKELLKLPQADVKFIHEFEEGKYIRTMIVPPNVAVTGAEHKTPYKVVLKQGTIAVNVDGEIKTLTAPFEMDVPPGMERAGVTFDEEVVWTDIYDNPDNCQNIQELEARLFNIPDCGLLNHRLLADKSKEDYKIFLEQSGLSEPEIRLISEIKEDLIEMPEEYSVEVRESNIQGLGMFATKVFEVDEVVCPARLNGNRTPAGRFTNHSNEYNLVPVKKEEDIYMVASKKILPGDELLVDYRDMLSINFNITVEG